MTKYFRWGLLWPTRIEACSVRFNKDPHFIRQIRRLGGHLELRQSYGAPM